MSALRSSRLGRYAARLPLRPRYWKESYRAARNLWTVYGHLRSVRSSAAVDAKGDPIPWYTYPAIEYLAQLDFTGKTVFEYGSGNSTLFWARMAARVVSVEDDETWYAEIARRVPGHCTLLYEPDIREYVKAIERFEPFDVIVVDGPARGRTRLHCARAAIARLRPGGLVILDNSDWLPESARFLRDADLLQVDMSGFIPAGGHTQTTSLFFHRECRLQPKHGRQPEPSLAAVRKNWESEPVIASAGDILEWEGQRIPGILARRTIDKSSPRGVERFELAVRAVKGMHVAYIYDCSRERILVGPYPVEPPRGAPAREAERLAAMPWPAFCQFVRQQDTRRYLLDPDVQSVSATVQNDESARMPRHDAVNLQGGPDDKPC